MYSTVDHCKYVHQKAKYWALIHARMARQFSTVTACLRNVVTWILVSCNVSYILYMSKNIWLICITSFSKLLNSDEKKTKYKICCNVPRVPVILYPGIRLKGLRKATKTVSQNIRSSVRYMNTESPEYQQKCWPLNHDLILYLELLFSWLSINSLSS